MRTKAENREAPAVGSALDSRLRQLVDQYERSLIVLALQAAGGSQKRAAQALRLLPSTLHEKMKRLGLLTSRAPGRAQAHIGSNEPAASADRPIAQLRPTARPP